MTRQTTSDLAKRIDRIDEKYERKIENMEKTAFDFRHELRKEYQIFKQWVHTEVDKFNSYRIARENYEAGLKDAEIKKEIKSGDVVPMEQFVKVVLKFLGVIGTVLGIIYLLLGATSGS